MLSCHVDVRQIEISSPHSQMAAVRRQMMSVLELGWVLLAARLCFDCYIDLLIQSTSSEFTRLFQAVCMLISFVSLVSRITR